MQRPPGAMLKAIAILDTISLWSGRIVAVLIIPMVLSLVYEVISRYIFDAPNPIRAGAVSVAVGSTGSFKHLETHELLTQDQLTEMLAGARECRQRYQSPRQPVTAS